MSDFDIHTELAEEGEMFSIKWLANHFKKEGKIKNMLEMLEKAFAAGDRESAFELACYYESNNDRTTMTKYLHLGEKMDSYKCVEKLDRLNTVHKEELNKVMVSDAMGDGLSLSDIKAKIKPPRGDPYWVQYTKEAPHWKYC